MYGIRRTRRLAALTAAVALIALAIPMSAFAQSSTGFNALELAVLGAFLLGGSVVLVHRVRHT